MGTFSRINDADDDADADDADDDADDHADDDDAGDDADNDDDNDADGDADNDADNDVDDLGSVRGKEEVEVRWGQQMTATTSFGDHSFLFFSFSDKPHSNLGPV